MPSAGPQLGPRLVEGDSATPYSRRSRAARRARLRADRLPRWSGRGSGCGWTARARRPRDRLGADDLDTEVEVEHRIVEQREDAAPQRKPGMFCRIRTALEEPMGPLEPPVRNGLLAPERRRIPGEPDGHPRRAQAVVALTIEAIRTFADVEHDVGHDRATRRRAPDLRVPRDFPRSRAIFRTRGGPPASRHEQAPPGRHRDPGGVGIVGFDGPVGSSGYSAFAFAAGFLSFTMQPRTD